MQRVNRTSIDPLEPWAPAGATSAPMRECVQSPPVYDLDTNKEIVFHPERREMAILGLYWSGDGDVQSITRDTELLWYYGENYDRRGYR